MPNVKCIAWNFDGSNFVKVRHWKYRYILEKLRFENGDIIPNVGSYFDDGEY
jgi:hypothetical protein